MDIHGNRLVIYFITIMHIPYHILGEAKGKVACQIRKGCITSLSENDKVKLRPDAKKSERTTLSKDAITSYFEQCHPNEVLITSGMKGVELKNNFEKHFSSLYGRKYYEVPMLLLTIIMGIDLLATLFSVEH